MTETRNGQARSLRVPLPLSRSGFGAGTPILTTEGALPVEYLSPGDRIITHDRGAVPLARMVLRKVPARAMLRLTPSALDPASAERAVLLSERQKIVLTGWRAQAMFARRSVLIDAARLVDGSYIARLEGKAPMPLFQLIFDDGPHVIALAGGALLAVSAPARTPVQVADPAETGR